jgi:hypothetical protein
MKRRTSRLASLGAIGALALAVAAPAAAADDAMVRVLHASPDAPAVDVFLDDTKVDALVNVPFGTISSYLKVPAGDHAIRVCANADNSVCPIPDTNLTFAGGQRYTIAATNALDSIDAQVLEDDPAPTSDAAQVRVVHFSADAPAVDVAPDGADALVSGLEYPDATDYLSLAGGTYDLEVRLAGTTTVALQLDPLAVEDGRSYSVFAIGSAGDPPVGDNGLTVVVAVDAVAAPPTDTAPASGTVPVVFIGLIALAGLAGFGGALRFAEVRARR